MAGYGSDGAFTAWLTSNGLTLPEAAPSPAILRLRGSQYIDGLYGSQFPGQPAGGFDQERAWPRTGAKAHGQDIPDDVIPKAIEHASYHAAYQEGLEPGSLSVVASASGAIKREKVEGLETEYFEASGDAVADGLVRISAVEGLMAPFLRTSAPASLGVWVVG